MNEKLTIEKWFDQKQKEIIEQLNILLQNAEEQYQYEKTADKIHNTRTASNSTLLAQGRIEGIKIAMSLIDGNKRI